jgi:hypothetical protein
MNRFSIDLKMLILDALKEEREYSLKTLLGFPAFDDYTTQEYKDAISEGMLMEHDLVDESIATLGLFLEDMDITDFREFQHETIELLVKKFERLKEDNLNERH